MVQSYLSLGTGNQYWVGVSPVIRLVYLPHLHCIIYQVVVEELGEGEKGREGGEGGSEGAR